MLQATVPEMQRSELAGTLLQLKALGIDNIMKWVAAVRDTGRAP